MHCSRARARPAEWTPVLGSRRRVATGVARRGAGPKDRARGCRRYASQGFRTRKASGFRDVSLQNVCVADTPADSHGGLGG